MQERYIFRELLSEIKELADQKGNRLTVEEVRDFFRNSHLTEDQLQMVYAYLEGEKIQVLGYQSSEKEAEEEKQDEGEIEEPYVESDYLEVYQEEIDGIKKVSSEEELRLFQMAAAGDSAAKNRLTEQYLRTVYDLSRTFAFGPIARGDLIQEGNVALMLALEELEFADKLEEYQSFLYEKISKAMESALNEVQDLQELNEKVAQRVNHLSEAIHNLETELEHKVSLEELSAYLDMPVEEMKAILNMAGDEIDVEGYHRREEQQ